MIRLILEIPIAIIKFILNIIFLIPMLIYKILIDHKASVLIFSGKSPEKSN